MLRVLPPVAELPTRDRPVGRISDPLQQTYFIGPDETFDVDTPLGPGRFVLTPARRPRANLILGHGAGAGIESSDLMRLARLLPAAGISVWRFDQPWRVAGRRLADRPDRLDLGWNCAIDQIRSARVLNGPLIVGGRSAGARVAMRTAVGLGAVGVVALAFPLRPRGRGTDRTDELAAAAADLPVLAVQGSRDAFGSAADLLETVPEHLRRRAAPPIGAGLCVVPLHSADHGIRFVAGPLTPDESWAQAEAVLTWWCRALAHGLGVASAA